MRRRITIAASAPEVFRVAFPALKRLSAVVDAARSATESARARATRRTKYESPHAVAYTAASRAAASNDARPTESSVWPASIKRLIAQRALPVLRRTRSISAESDASLTIARNSSALCGA